MCSVRLINGNICGGKINERTEAVGNKKVLIAKCLKCGRIDHYDFPEQPVQLSLFEEETLEFAF